VSPDSLRKTLGRGKRAGKEEANRRGKIVIGEKKKGLGKKICLITHKGFVEEGGLRFVIPYTESSDGGEKDWRGGDRKV